VRGGLLGLSIFILLAATRSAATPPPLTARFIGNMAFAITDGSTTLFTDFPYQSGAFGYMSYSAAEVAPARHAVCLITHSHLDHFDPSLFAKMDAKVIAPPALAATLPADRVIPFGPKIVYDDMTVEPIRTPHGSIEHDSYLVTWHGLRLYFTGDTDAFDDLVSRRALDYAFVSPWLLRATAEKKVRIDARRVIVYHHKAGETIPPFPNAVVPKQGETLRLD
jgi:L-ascorbate metabolism protein UlaG (beta-lactamase superfamily)